MSRSTQHGRDAIQPRVDEGEPPDRLRVVLALLKPFPGRMANTLRVTVLSLAAVVIFEVFRIPEVALAAAAPLIFFKDDADSTTIFAAIGSVLVAGCMLLTILLLMLDLSQPALRVSLMLFITLAGTYFSRVIKGGQLLYLATFFLVYTQMQADHVLKGSLAPDVLSNNTSLELPDIVFMPPEEALLHNILWFVLTFVVPGAMIFVVNRLASRGPVEKFRTATADRLAAAARACEGDPAARKRLVGFAKEGTASLTKLNNLAGKTGQRPHDPKAGTELVRGVTALVLALFAWDRTRQEEGPHTPPQDVVVACRRAERALREGRWPVVDTQGGAPAASAPDGTDPGMGLLADELRRSLQTIEHALGNLFRAPAKTKTEGKSPKTPPAPDASTNPDPIHFALKLTLAVVIAYLFLSLADWSSISTIITTIFLVSLDTLGQSARKMMLRVSGAAVGGALGFVTILLIMPLLTDIGQLLIVLAPVVFVSAWILVGSQRIAYFGLQLALGFLLTVLQDYGPTLHFQVARDRCIGVLLGDILVFVVFANIWPVRVADLVRSALAEAVDHLSDLVGCLEGEKPADHHHVQDLRQRFGAAIGKVRAALPDQTLELEDVSTDSHHRIDAMVVTQIQALLVPVSVLLAAPAAQGGDAAAPGNGLRTVASYPQAMSDWLKACSRWIRTGQGGEDLRTTLPAAPASDDPSGSQERTDRGAAHHFATPLSWYRILNEDIEAILNRVGPIRDNGAIEPRRQLEAKPS